MAFNFLIVDDSETVRAVIAKTLHVAGLPINELYQAANGKDALDILAGHWADLIFTDINMPVMDGIEFIDRLGADDMLKSIPVVIVSTEGSQTRIEQLKAKGAVAYVRKPFQPELIRKVVEETLGAPNEN
ncbi:response regulator [bacterium]|nr:response regulator [bacterium]